MGEYLLNINRLQQEKYNFCGPACIQMILASIGVQKTQQAIWDDTRQLLQDAKNWFTDPEAIAVYLASVAEISKKIKIKSLSIPRLTDHFAKILRAADRDQFPSLLSVYKGKHWVLCTGFQGEYLDDLHEHLKVSGIYIADPSRGSSGIEFYPITEWFIEEFLNIVAIPGKWQDTLVTITDDDPDAIDTIDLPPPSRPIGGGGGELDPTEVFTLISEDIQHYGLANNTEVAMPGNLGLSVAESSDIGLCHSDGNVNPVAVRGLDDESLYYISPITINGRVKWAAFSSNYLTLMAVQLNGTFRPPSSGDALRKIVESKFDSVNSYQEHPNLYRKQTDKLRGIFDVIRKVEVNSKEYFVDRFGVLYSDFDNTLGG